MRSRAEITAARSMLAEGSSSAQVARRLGIPRTTVRDWSTRWQRDDAWPASRAAELRRQCLEPHRLPSAEYAYLLGLYLGDGHIVEGRRGVFTLRITLDRAYPGIVASAADAIAAVLPHNKVAAQPHPRHNAVVVRASSKSWPDLIPQHGAGAKHQRAIALTNWQRSLTGQTPQHFIRGLIHSDGCRFVARQRRGNKYYEYVRYSFTNESPQIRRLLCEHLDLLDIPWTKAGSGNQIAVATRRGVTMLDEFVGPKR